MWNQEASAHEGQETRSSGEVPQVVVPHGSILRSWGEMKGGGATVLSHRTGVFSPPVDAACMFIHFWWLQSTIPGSFSRTVWFQTVPEKAGWWQVGFEFQEIIFVAPTSFFSPKDWKGFQRLGESSSASVTLLVSRNPPLLQWQLSHLLSEDSQKYPAKELTFWSILQGCKYLYKVSLHGKKGL